MVKLCLIGMRALTHVHVGEGKSRGAIDLPVAREQHDGMPVVPGSSVKGALRSLFSKDDAAVADAIFGPRAAESEDTDPDRAAGAALFGDAALIALPIRSDMRPFLYVTAPVLLNRFSQYLQATGGAALTGFDDLAGEDGPDALAMSASSDLLLEDLKLDNVQAAPESVKAIAGQIAAVVGTDAKGIESGLVVVGDDIMRWLAAHALPVRARNHLDEKKTVKTGQLWYEETLPPETLMAGLWGSRNDIDVDGTPTDPVAALWDSGQLVRPANGDDRLVQIGGNETVGQGWFRIHRGDPS